MWIQAKVRIFKACVLPVLLYGSEVWCLKKTEEQRLNTFYMKCLRTIIGVSLSDRMRNELVLQLTGQPSLEQILKRNRLRWFGHVNRMNNEQGYPLLPKKTLFASFKDMKRPPHGIKLRWRDKISKDITTSAIKNWRRETRDKNKWRKSINHDIRCTKVHTDITRIVREHKERAANRRAEQNITKSLANNSVPIIDAATYVQCRRICKNDRGLKIDQRTCGKKVIDTYTAGIENAQQITPIIIHQSQIPRQRKITDLLMNDKNEYICPNENCGRSLRPQGTTAHVESCAKEWIKEQDIGV